MSVLSQLVYCKVALGINPNRYFKRFSSSIVQSLFLRNIHVRNIQILPTQITPPMMCKVFRAF